MPHWMHLGLLRPRRVFGGGGGGVSVRCPPATPAIEEEGGGGGGMAGFWAADEAAMRRASERERGFVTSQAMFAWRDTRSIGVRFNFGAIGEGGGCF